MTIGRTVAGALSQKLVDQLNSQGYVAKRAADAHVSDDGNILTIKGQFISIDEGNRTERVVVGLGMGRSDVRVAVQMAERMPSARGQPPRIQMVETMQTDARSGYKPGMAETAGAASVAGHVGMGIAMGAGTAVGSEAFSANVDADADRAAKQIAKRIQLIYQSMDWSGM